MNDAMGHVLPAWAGGCFYIKRKEENLPLHGYSGRGCTSKISKKGMLAHPYFTTTIGFSKHGDGFKEMMTVGECVLTLRINKACPKDGYPAGKATEDDVEKTPSSQTKAFCYTEYAFRLRNAGANPTADSGTGNSGQIVETLKLYVDDLSLKVTGG
ncbi:hypothetical protein Tco_0792813 [Tanacetum coccineum]